MTNFYMLNCMIKFNALQLIMLNLLMQFKITIMALQNFLQVNCFYLLLHVYYYMENYSSARCKMKYVALIETA